MADVKVTALVEDTSPTLEDLLMMVNDPGGAPASRKIKIGSLAKALGWFDVRHYSAVGDGVTDDTAEIQAAATAAAGGTLYFPPTANFYLISDTIDISSGTEVRGAGPSSCIKAAANFGDLPLFRNLTINPANDAARDSGIIFRDLKIDGNRANNGTGTQFSHCISLIAAVKSKVLNCQLISPLGDGVCVAPYTTGPIHADDIEVKDNNIYDAYRNGIASTGGHRQQFVHNIIHTTTATAGIDVEPDADYDIQDILIQGNIIWLTDQMGINIGGNNVTSVAKKRNISIRDNIIISPADATFGFGIRLISSGSPTTISGNMIFDAGEDGIHVDANSHDVIIIGNTIYQADRYAIYQLGDRFVISGNYIFADADFGIELNTADGGTISGNTIYTSGEIFGIELVGANDIDVSGNFLRGSGTGAGNGRGIRDYSSTNSYIHGNRITNFEYGILISNTGSDSTLLGDNHFEGNGTNVLDQRVSTGVVTLSNKGVSSLNSSAGAVTATLGSGDYIGQIKTIVMTEASNPSTLSVTNHETSDPETFAFAAVDDTAVFMWTGTEWITIKLSGATAT